MAPLWEAYGAAERGDRDASTTGHRRRDTSGPTTDQAMTRSEEELQVGTQTREAGRARLRKYVTTETQTVTVPVSREEVRVEREPITDANLDDATSGPAISEEEHEVTLREETPVVEKRAVPKERVRLDTETVTEDRQVSEEAAKSIQVDGEQGSPRDRRRRQRGGREELPACWRRSSPLLAQGEIASAETHPIGSHSMWYLRSRNRRLPEGHAGSLRKVPEFTTFSRQRSPVAGSTRKPVRGGGQWTRTSRSLVPTQKP